MTEEFKTKSIMACEQCGANLSVDPNLETVTCEYCGSSYSVSALLGESEEVRLNKLKFKQEQERRAQREAEFAQRAQRRALEEEEKRQQKFDKGIFSKSLIVGFVFILFMLIGTIEEQYYVTSALLIGQAVFVALAWLTGRQIIHTKNKLIYRVFTILVVAMIVPVVIGLAEEDSYSYAYEDHSVTYEWPSTELTNMIPKPDTDNGRININSTECFDIDTYGISEEQKTNFINTCKANGFTLEQSATSSRYTAFNSEGYKLEVYYFDNDELDISLSAPKGVGTLIWPSTGIASAAPKPVSTQGKINSDNATSFNAEVGNTNADAFASYTAACLDAGFDIDYRRTKDYFSGQNKDGIKITADYYGANVMIIQIWKY